MLYMYARPAKKSHPAKRNPASRRKPAAESVEPTGDNKSVGEPENKPNVSKLKNIFDETIANETIKAKQNFRKPRPISEALDRLKSDHVSESAPVEVPGRWSLPTYYKKTLPATPSSAAGHKPHVSQGIAARRAMFESGSSNEDVSREREEITQFVGSSSRFERSGRRIREASWKDEEITPEESVPELELSPIGKHFTTVTLPDSNALEKNELQDSRPKHDSIFFRDRKSEEMQSHEESESSADESTGSVVEHSDADEDHAHPQAVSPVSLLFSAKPSSSALIAKDKERKRKTECDICCGYAQDVSYLQCRRIRPS
ncbi:hypothetical protein OS493_034182 [Desmophyllum pertusum]|uniref:Uncharacterized protein n=1 Tax=Desmophyllum pertusum TaxID=174260 RepID=A0A9W9ZW90_9CNID|nr:hypothetical protein OS493_034182 [Desmophyllum pertusum]